MFTRAIRQTCLVLALSAGLRTALALPAESLTERQAGVPQLGGVNLAGCEFGMNTTGFTDGFECPPPSQITHFKQHGVNLFRLPLGWQYLIDSETSSKSESFDGAFFAQYDALVQRVIGDGKSYAIIDVHNYARFQGRIIGQGENMVPVHDFTTLWWKLADKYKNNKNVIFGLMNEPHEVDMVTWAGTCQSAVNAIRNAGATDQIILLPGTGYSAADLYSNGVNDALLSITDPARPGSTSHLQFEAHKYIDATHTGKEPYCVEDGVGTWTAFADWLRAKGRKAMITEIGAGDNPECHTLFGRQVAFIAGAADVFSGWTVWSAGSFRDNYELGIKPINGKNNQLFELAIKPYLPGN